MKFKIHDGKTEDSLVISGETIEDCRAEAKKEVDKRGWKDFWSEAI